LFATATVAALGACGRVRSPMLDRGPLVAMYPGRIDDRGFIEASYAGLLRVRDEIGIPVHYVDNVASNEESVKAALRELADSSAKLVIAHGDQTSEAVQRVAWEFPEQRFAIIQGHLTRPNLAIYDVMQEQSSWLAGAAAGLLTRSKVVGHMGNQRVRADLRARAAFAAGLAFTNPQAKLLTNFSPIRDDPAAAKRIALAEIRAGADILYTMLDASRNGVTEACRERGVRQIGSVRDWVAAMPNDFVASAVADAGVAVVQLGRDVYDNLWKGDLVKRIGARNPAAVRLALNASVPEGIKSRIAVLTQEVAAGSIKIPESYAGAEFDA
jgi:basic membrane protein A